MNPGIFHVVRHSPKKAIESVGSQLDIDPWLTGIDPGSSCIHTGTV